MQAMTYGAMATGITAVNCWAVDRQDVMVSLPSTLADSHGFTRVVYRLRYYYWATSNPLIVAGAGTLVGMNQRKLAATCLLCAFTLACGVGLEMEHVLSAEWFLLLIVALIGNGVVMRVVGGMLISSQSLASLHDDPTSYMLKWMVPSIGLVWLAFPVVFLCAQLGVLTAQQEGIIMPALDGASKIILVNILVCISSLVAREEEEVVAQLRQVESRAVLERATMQARDQVISDFALQLKLPLASIDAAINKAKAELNGDTINIPHQIMIMPSYSFAAMNPGLVPPPSADAVALHQAQLLVQQHQTHGLQLQTAFPAILDQQQAQQAAGVGQRPPPISRAAADPSNVDPTPRNSRAEQHNSASNTNTHQDNKLVTMAIMNDGNNVAGGVNIAGANARENAGGDAGLRTQQHSQEQQPGPAQMPAAVGAAPPQQQPVVVHTSVPPSTVPVPPGALDAVYSVAAATKTLSRILDDFIAVTHDPTGSGMLAAPLATAASTASTPGGTPHYPTNGVHGPSLGAAATAQQQPLWKLDLAPVSLMQILDSAVASLQASALRRGVTVVQQVEDEEEDDDDDGEYDDDADAAVINVGSWGHTHSRHNSVTGGAAGQHYGYGSPTPGIGVTIPSNASLPGTGGAVGGSNSSQIIASPAAVRVGAPGAAAGAVSPQVTHHYHHQQQHHHHHQHGWTASGVVRPAHVTRNNNINNAGGTGAAAAPAATPGGGVGLTIQRPPSPDRINRYHEQQQQRHLQAQRRQQLQRRALASRSAVPDVMWSDPSRLQFVCLAMLSKSLTLCSEGGRVEISIRPYLAGPDRTTTNESEPDASPTVVSSGSAAGAGADNGQRHAGQQAQSQQQPQQQTDHGASMYNQSAAGYAIDTNGDVRTVDVTEAAGDANNTINVVGSVILATGAAAAGGLIGILPAATSPPRALMPPRMPGTGPLDHRNMTGGAEYAELMSVHMVRIYFIDDGPGLSKHQLRMMFERGSDFLAAARSPTDGNGGSNGGDGSLQQLRTLGSHNSAASLHRRRGLNGGNGGGNAGASDDDSDDDGRQQHQQRSDDGGVLTSVGRGVGVAWRGLRGFATRAAAFVFHPLPDVPGGSIELASSTVSSSSSTAVVSASGAPSSSATTARVAPTPVAAGVSSSAAAAGANANRRSQSPGSSRRSSRVRPSPASNGSGGSSSTGGMYLCRAIVEALGGTIGCCPASAVDTTQVIRMEHRGVGTGQLHAYGPSVPGGGQAASASSFGTCLYMDLPCPVSRIQAHLLSYQRQDQARTAAAAAAAAAAGARS